VTHNKTHSSKITFKTIIASLASILHFSWLTEVKIENLVKIEPQNTVSVSRINPLSRLEAFFRQRRLKKEKKVLQLQLAILSGGITRMK